MYCQYALLRRTSKVLNSTGGLVNQAYNPGLTSTWRHFEWELRDNKCLDSK